MHKGHYHTATIVGTGAALPVACGFRPNHVKVINVTAAATLEWTAGMANGGGLKQATSGALTVLGAGAGGISPSGGTPGAQPAGFEIGADAINTAGQTLIVIAISSDG